jgi:N-acetyl-gamma-glutamyl-phosphate reductase
MLNTLVVGASGYAGAELVNYLHRHPYINLTGLMVSAQSNDVGKDFAELYPQFRGQIDLKLQPFDSANQAIKTVDVVFLATAHEVSHDLAAVFHANGVKVIDLSGAYRVPNGDFYADYYGFSHQQPQLLNQAVYGLAEWNSKALATADMIAVPGCYPTAVQLALKPLLAANLLSQHQWPVINATSGVSGAGRKADLKTSLCEVGLQPYGLFTHRHQPEISYHLGVPVIFTPQLGNFPRGILATVTCKLQAKVTAEMISQAFSAAYQHAPLVRVHEHGLPSLKAVVGQPYCDIGFAMQDEHLIIVSAIDNLLKGAAAQAVQCLNIRFDYPQTTSLIGF